MNSKEYKLTFKNFLFFNLYDKNLYNEKYKNPHEIYENQLINKKNIINEEDKLNSENKKNNNDIFNKNKTTNILDNKGKCVDQPIKTKYICMNIFNRNNYNIFDKSQNFPISNKFLKNDV